MDAQYMALYGAFLLPTVIRNHSTEPHALDFSRVLFGALMAMALRSGQGRVGAVAQGRA